MDVKARAEELFQTISERVGDPVVSGWVAEEVMQPLAGIGAPVWPPTYAHPEGTSREEAKRPLHAVSGEAFVPDRRQGSSWFDVLQRGVDGGPRLATSVILDSVGSRGGRVEAALWNRREELGGLPAFVVTGRQDAEGFIGKVRPMLKDEARESIASLHLSSWSMPHRHADAWVRFALDPSTGSHVREGGGELPRISEFNTDFDGSEMFVHSPNSILFGFWYSQDSGVRNRQARIYSSEIVGYGAHPVKSGATRFDAVPMSKDHKIKIDGKDRKPSDVGLGLVPGSPETRAFSCELILNRASISLSALRNVRYGPEHATRSHAASVLLAVMGMVGHVLASRDETLLRSGCDLMVTEANYGWRRSRRVDVEPFELPEDVEVLLALFARARDQAAKVGLEFAEPIQLSASSEEVEGMAKSFTEDKAEDDQ